MQLRTHETAVNLAYAGLLLRHKGDPVASHMDAVDRRLDPKVIALADRQKNAVTGSLLDNTLIDTSSVDGFLGVLRPNAILGQIYPYLNQIPLNTRTAVVTSGPSGYTRTGPGYPIPVTSLALAQSVLEVPHSCCDGPGHR